MIAFDEEFKQLELDHEKSRERLESILQDFNNSNRKQIDVKLWKKLRSNVAVSQQATETNSVGCWRLSRAIDDRCQVM
jgi:hypothetical protein